MDIHKTNEESKHKYPILCNSRNYSPLYVKDKNEAYNDSIFKVIVNNAFADYKGKMKGFELIIITLY